MELPHAIGGPPLGRPVIDSDEYDRLDVAVNQMVYPTQIEGGGGVHRNLLPFFYTLLVGSVRHVGKAATRIVPTACVWVDDNSQLNMAFNPYYVDELQSVLVKYPASAAEAEKLRLGSGPDGRPWLVRPSYYRLPSFVRASIFRQALEEKLRAAGEDLQPGWVGQLPSETWNISPEELGIDTSGTIAVRVDNRALIGLFVHEVLHVAHLHLLVDRMRYPDARTLNLAMDTAIDQFIDDKYNNKWTFFRDLFQMVGEPALEPDMPFDYYYQRLDAFFKKNNGKPIQTPQGPVIVHSGPQPPGQPGYPGKGCPSCGSPGQGQGQGQGQQGQGQGQQGQGQGQGQPGQGQPGAGPGSGQPGSGGRTGSGGFPGLGLPGAPGRPGSAQPGSCPVCGTPHGQGQPGQGQGQPGQGQGQPGQGQGPLGGKRDPNGVLHIYVPINVDEHDWKKPTPVSKFAQGAWLQTFLQKSREREEWGKALGSLVRSIEGFLRPSVSWQPYLRRFLGDMVRIGKEATRKRPSRRLGWDAPGSKTVRSGKVVVAVDNSGSISQAEIMQFFGEIGSFVTQLEVVVIVWDTAIRSIEKVSSRGDLARIGRRLGGGGGTDVIPVFAAVKDPSLVPDARARGLIAGTRGVIVLTDGDLYWPDEEYDVVPTLWGITKESNLTGPKFGIPLYVNIQKNLQGAP